MSLNASSIFMPWVDIAKDQEKADGAHQNGSSPPSLPLTTDFNRLKKFVRKGQWPVNHAIRQELWHHICMQNVVTAGSVYKETAHALYGDDKQSPSDHNANQGHQTFGNEDHLLTYKLSQAGKDQLDQLLCVIAHTRPDINYCPLLHPVASLLLHYMDAERAFDCLCALLGSRNYKYLDQSWVEFEAYRRSFTKLAKKFATQANSMIAKQSGDPGAVYQDWIWWILEDLPFTHLIRVMDCYFMEGLKIFYRVALAILQLFKKRKGYTGSSGDFASSIRQFAKTIPVTPEVLLGLGFQFRGLSRTVIDTYNTKFKNNIREEGLTPPIKKTNTEIPAVLNEVKSSIISPKQLQSFWRWLPQRMTLMQPRLVFTTTEHGVSLNTFYNMCEDEEQTILLIKTLDNEVFGAYLPSPWSTRNSRELKTSYFGNGESFLFTLTPKEQQFPWVGLSDREKKEPLETASQLFMRGTNNLISIGGGDGEGVHLQSDISEGWSESCKTFNNPPLATNSRFQCEIIEVLAFQDVCHKAGEKADTQTDTVTETVGEPQGEPTEVTTVVADERVQSDHGS